MIKGLQCIIGRLEVFRCERINTALSKTKGWMDFFSYVECIRTKTFQFNFLAGHNVWEHNCYLSSTQRNVVAIMVTKPEFLVAKDEMLVALVTVSITISSPGWLLKYYARVKPAVLWTERAKLALYSFFWGPSLIVTQDSHNGAL